MPIEVVVSDSETSGGDVEMVPPLAPAHDTTRPHFDSMWSLAADGHVV